MSQEQVLGIKPTLPQVWGPSVRKIVIPAISTVRSSRCNWSY